MGTLKPKLTIHIDLMPKLPECDRCLLYACAPHLVCAVHPTGLDADIYIDFRPDPNAKPEELWKPEEAKYINGELVIKRSYYL